jgi:chromosome partitioning protein
MAHVIALANHKGGCAKTTSAANLGAALAAAPLNQRVLLIDADPQANLSTMFGCDPELAGPRLQDALDHQIADTLPSTPWRTHPGTDGHPQPLAGGVHVLPCSDELEVIVADHLAARTPNYQHRLRELVSSYDDHYDYILIDTPPGRQALSTMALLAAHWVITPIRPADFDVDGAIGLVELLEHEIAAYNPTVRILGVLVTQTDRRWKIDADARAALTEAGIGILARQIPFAVRVGQAPRHRAPTIVLEPDGRVGSAYRDVATDIHHFIGPLTASPIAA